MVKTRTYNGHETARMHTLDGSPLASFTQRAIAWVIDFALAFALFLAVIIPGGRVAENFGLLHENVNLKFDFHHWYSLAFLVAYFALANYFGNGKTPGKWILRIRAVSLVHEHLSLWHSIERALGYGASFLEGGFGFVQYFIHPNRRTVHDRIAETIVVNERRPRPRAASASSAAED